MLPLIRSKVWIGFALSLTLPLGSCANSSLERSLAADPQLQTGAGGFGRPNAASSSPLRATAALPPDFPEEIPIYPDAALQAVTATTTEDGSDRPNVLTRWLTTASATEVQQFYQQAFQSQGWQVNSTGISPLEAVSATKNGLQVTLNLASVASPAPAASPVSTTDFSLSYRQRETGDSSVTPTAESATTSSASPSTKLPQPGDPTFIGPLLPNPETVVGSSSPSSTSSPAVTAAIATPQQFSDLAQVPAELQSYVGDLAQLGVLNVSSGQDFKPNQVITRREFARWLVNTNNRLYATRPGNQIRLGVATEQPAFQDVPRNDADFATIQGLATAGIVPSPLSGNSTTVTFRPNAPLTREDLILWKTPLDTRQALPNATLDAVQQTWGFQDTPRIDPKALRAVLADYQNSDLANIRRAFGYTTLFQPKKPVTRAEAAAVLWHFGTQGDGISAKEVGQSTAQIQ